METIDTGLAQRVWQRVNGTQQSATAGGADILNMVFHSHGLAGLYQGLQKQLAGQENARIRELYRQHRDLTACLKGMLLISGETLPGLPPMVPATGSLRSVLEGCFHRESRLENALAARSGDKNLGNVFRMLEKQAVSRTAAVLELLGEIKGI